MEYRLGAWVLPAVESADLARGNHQDMRLEAFTTDTPGGDGIQDAAFMRVSDRRKLERGEVLRKLSGIHFLLALNRSTDGRDVDLLIFVSIPRYFPA
ncbi:MAG: hypothetical protein JO015_04975 [Verrucomicrobia bacterium]|nr:hypothetical protein [Verrucomicrobiota bacterium]